MTSSRDTYHAMMLRLWRDDHAKQWRASIQDPHTGEKRRFANIEQFCAYLHSKLSLSGVQREEARQEDEGSSSKSSF